MAIHIGRRGTCEYHRSSSSTRTHMRMRMHARRYAGSQVDGRVLASTIVGGQTGFVVLIESRRCSTATWPI
jgi:hypothetical protein